MLLFEVRIVDIKSLQCRYNLIQNGTFSRYLKNILLHVLVSNWYFCTQNYIKWNIFESNQHKIEITLCKSRFCVKIKVKLIFHILNDHNQIMIVHMCNTDLVISKSISERYFFEIHLFGILWISNCILSLFVSPQPSRPSLHRSKRLYNE